MMPSGIPPLKLVVNPLVLLYGDEMRRCCFNKSFKIKTVKTIIKLRFKDFSSFYRSRAKLLGTKLPEMMRSKHVQNIFNT